MPCCFFSGVKFAFKEFVFFRFRKFSAFISLNPWPFVYNLLRCACARTATRSNLPTNCLCPLLAGLFFVSLETSLCQSIMNRDHSLPFHFCIERTSYVFRPDGIFLPWDHRLDILIPIISLVCLIIQSTKQIRIRCRRRFLSFILEVFLVRSLLIQCPSVWFVLFIS